MIVAPQPMKRAGTRRGISLVELLVVLSGCSVVLSTTGVLLHRAMRGESETRHMFDVEQAALRLSHQFRDDVHHAVEVQAPTNAPDNELLHMTLQGGQTVRYARDEESVFRVLFQGDQPLSREEYHLGAASEITVAELTDPRRISLTISSRMESPTGRGRELRASEIRRAPVSLQLIAVAGRNASFAPAPGSAKEAP